MNVTGMIIAELKRRRAKAANALQAADAALALFVDAPATVKRHRRTKEEIAAGVPKGTKKPRTQAQKDAIAKALAARKAKLQESKGAPLAVAAGE